MSDQRLERTKRRRSAKGNRRDENCEAAAVPARKRRGEPAAEGAGAAGAGGTEPEPAASPGRSARAAAGARRRLAATGLAARAAWAERATPPLAGRRGLRDLAPGLICLVFGALIFGALAAATSAERLARAWTAEFGAAATLIVAGPAQGRAARFEAAVAALETTPGIIGVRPLPVEERRALIAPWLGPGEVAPPDPPPMAAVRLGEDPPDPDMLALRLREEAPGAVYDDHAAWRGPLLGAAGLARDVGWGAAAAAGAAGAAAAAVSAAAWTAQGRGDQRLLRGLGASAAQVTRAWAGRAAGRALLWGGLGAGLAALALGAPGWWGNAAVPVAPQGAGWAWAAAAPALLGLSAWAGARLALRPALRRPPGADA
jgi:cell division transport system permease protein